MAANPAFLVVPRGRCPRKYRGNRLYEQMNDRELRERYRFGRDGINYIVELLRARLERPTRRGHALTVQQQVLLALRFYATGSFLQTVGDGLGLDKSTTSRVVTQVTNELVNLKKHFIIWPTTREQKKKISNGFFRKRGMPNIIGCVDGTHIRLQQPPQNKRAYINRKHYASINAMVVCDDKGKFTFINSAWPGSSHDSMIWRASVLSDYLETHNRDFEDGVLLGDSGYPSKPYMLTPYREPEVTTAAERAYQYAHCSTRSAIERAIGVCKRKFAVLHGETRMKPVKLSKIIVACAILHNIAINLNEPQDVVNDGADDQPGNVPYVGPDEGQALRRHVTRQYFTV